MAGAGKKGRRIPGVRSIRSQVTGMLLACYLIPAVLLGAFARLVLVRGLEKRTRDAITSEADHAWSQTEQQMDRLVDLKKEIQDYVKKRTAPYKYPRIVEFRDELPKTVSGKIIRNQL